MNLLNQIMSYEKIKNDTQENCNCSECISIETLNSNNQITEYPKLSEEEIEKIIEITIGRLRIKHIYWYIPNRTRKDFFQRFLPAV